jgi:uroporphyrinogen decarboxylase
MKLWKKNLFDSSVKKAMPVLSFPCVQLMGINVEELISGSESLAAGMIKVAKRTDSLASLGMMDLSVEAEVFGSEIRTSSNEVPTVTGKIIESIDDANKLKVPDVLSGRSSLYINAVEKAIKEIKDRPVFAGVIGPFSLAGRLMDMSEIMINCYEDPDMVNIVLEKTAAFISDYAMEYKRKGANGVFMAEPAAGLLSPGLVEEFSSRYIKKIADRLKDDNFLFIYHNCGPNTPFMLSSLLNIGADMYHFGDAIQMAEVLEKIPEDIPVMGNISPSVEFLGGTPKSIYAATIKLLQECSKYKNFIISSGCDIPPMSSWENIDSFFSAVKDFYG